MAAWRISHRLPPVLSEGKRGPDFSQVYNRHYDWFAGLGDAERDRRFRERFDQMDSNHDGVVDPAERAAWHDKQRAFFGRGRTAAAEPAAARQPR